MTSKTIEKELKLVIDRDSYYKIIQIANKNQKLDIINQKNYYFDTLDYKLQKSGITLRVRKEKRELFLTLKIKDTSNLNLSFVSSTEFETKLPLVTLQKLTETPTQIIKDLPDEGLEVLKSLNIQLSTLKFIGSIFNKRYKLRLMDNYVFELDYTELPHNNVSYELEIEGITTEEQCSNILNYLSNYQISYSVNTMSKYNRFIELIK
ncbi:CYTH domain-containing protein [Priestia aryabhattai]|uniref:CYTH domain-containing protein n=1 Tax=Priestia aryabhattai TaxID=412384 RepID=UPI003D7FC7D1